MSKLIYFMPMSLDGFVAGETDNTDWSMPDEEVSAFINDLHRPIGTYLYVRRNYETMTVWETTHFNPGRMSAMTDFGRIWRAADKIVYSKSLETVSTLKTRLEREFEPQAVHDLKTQLPHDVSVAGPNLAAQAIRAGLVDEYQLLVIPMLLGGGKAVLASGTGVKPDLLDECRVGLSSPSHAGLMEAAALRAGVSSACSADKDNRSYDCKSRPFVWHPLDCRQSTLSGQWGGAAAHGTRGADRA